MQKQTQRRNGAGRLGRSGFVALVPIVATCRPGGAGHQQYLLVKMRRGIQLFGVAQWKSGGPIIIMSHPQVDRSKLSSETPFCIFCHFADTSLHAVINLQMHSCLPAAPLPAAEPIITHARSARKN